VKLTLMTVPLVRSPFLRPNTTRSPTFGRSMFLCSFQFLVTVWTNLVLFASIVVTDELIADLPSWEDQIPVSFSLISIPAFFVAETLDGIITVFHFCSFLRGKQGGQAAPERMGIPRRMRCLHGIERRSVGGRTPWRVRVARCRSAWAKDILSSRHKLWCDFCPIGGDVLNDLHRLSCTP